LTGLERNACQPFENGLQATVDGALDQVMLKRAGVGLLNGVQGSAGGLLL